MGNIKTLSSSNYNFVFNFRKAKEIFEKENNILDI